MPTEHEKFFIIDNQRISHREAEVLLCCAYGYTCQEAADALGISYHTIKTHKQVLRIRFGITGHHSLAMFAVKNATFFEPSVKLSGKIRNIT